MTSGQKVGGGLGLIAAVISCPTRRISDMCRRAFAHDILVIKAGGTVYLDTGCLSRNVPFGSHSGQMPHLNISPLSRKNLLPNRNHSVLRQFYVG